MADDKLPNKCNYCGLRVRITLDTDGKTVAHDTDFAKLRRLYEAGIIRKKFKRSITVSLGSPEPDTTDICAISAKAWNKNEISCRHWMISIEGASVADYLAIHASRSNLDVAILALIVSMGAVLISIFK